MVTKPRHDDPSRLERVDQLANGLRGQIWLVAHGDQHRIDAFGQRAHADGNRASDAALGMRVFDRHQVQPGQRVNQARVTRHDDDNRLKAGVDQTASGVSDQRLTTPWFEEFLTTEPGRLPGCEQDSGDQLAGVAVLSSWSTQLANRCAMR